MKLSSSVERLKPSPTISAGEEVRKLLAKGKDIVRFDIGEPDFDTPEHIRKAGIDAINRGYTHYTSTRGIPELREALVADQKRAGLGLSTSNVVFYPGSKIALYSVLSLLVDEGAEVIMQDPIWATYASIVEYLGGTPIRVRDWTDQNPDSFSAEEFEKKISSKTRAILVNSPCNPTGAVVPDREIEQVLKISSSKQVPFILDRIYSALTYDGVEDRIPPYDIEDGNLIVISGFSKEFAMTGWRLGYTVAPKAFTDLLVQFQDNTTTCPPSFVQYAAVAALNGARDWQKKMIAEYKERRDTMVSGINELPGWKCSPPKGAFYCFPFVGNSQEDSISLSANLLSQCGVSSVAGEYFGEQGRSHLRLSYTTPKERIVEGMSRIRKYLDK